MGAQARTVAASCLWNRQPQLHSHLGPGCLWISTHGHSAPRLCRLRAPGSRPLAAVPRLCSAAAEPAPPGPHSPPAGSHPPPPRQTGPLDQPGSFLSTGDRGREAERRRLHFMKARAPLLPKAASAPGLHGLTCQRRHGWRFSRGLMGVAVSVEGSRGGCTGQHGSGSRSWRADVGYEWQ